MSPIEVIYEHGVLCPLSPLELAEGTRLEVTVAEVASPSNQQARERIDEARYTAFLTELDRIAALPPQSAAQPHTVRDHDAILYPPLGKTPLLH